MAFEAKTVQGPSSMNITLSKCNLIPSMCRVNVMAHLSSIKADLDSIKNKILNVGGLEQTIGGDC